MQTSKASVVRDGPRWQSCVPGAVASDRPVVSIIIPAFNAEATLAAAITSVLSQDATDFELLVVNDGSLDRTLRVALDASGEDGRVTIISQQNAGTASALNAGWRAARGEFIAALGADDWLDAGYLATMCDFMASHPGYDIYSHDCWMIAPDGTRRRGLGWMDVRSVTMEELLRECVILGGGTLVKRDLMVKLGGYRHEMYNEDYDLWLRAMAAGARHIYAPYALYYYVLRSDGHKTADSTPMYSSAVEMFRELLSNNDLSASQQSIAGESVARFESYLDEAQRYGGRTQGQLVEGFAADERAAVKKLLGSVLPETSADRWLGRMRAIAWLVRPLRRIIWRIRLWLGKTDAS